MRVCLNGICGVMVLLLFVQVSHAIGVTILKGKEMELISGGEDCQISEYQNHCTPDPFCYPPPDGRIKEVPKFYNNCVAEGADGDPDTYKCSLIYLYDDPYCQGERRYVGCRGTSGCAGEKF